ncbi:MAG: hypothetical protein ACYTGV_03790 [Planctomycetota bacterium]|jgi:hypothetical protein
MPKRSRIGRYLVALLALGLFASGYFLGLLHGSSEQPGQGRLAQPRSVVHEDWLGSDEEAWSEDLNGEGEEVMPVPGAEAASEAEPVTPSELLDALRKTASSPRSQQILIGMVADAARVGGAMLPEIRRLLDEGVDIEFPSYKGKGPGYPSLRVALLAAAEATGSPEAVGLIAEVAQTSESAVEVVFSAHILDRLDSLDQEIAQRALDALSKPLTGQEKKAMASVVRQVIPAAARADPAYAENLLAVQLRVPEGEPRMDPRLLAPVLDGLPLDSARNLVLNSITAPDIPDRTKSLMAGRAAQRAELDMLTDLRSAIESNTLPPRVSTTIARSAMGGSRYGRMERSARKAVRKGDLAKAQTIAKSYQSRLVEAQKTVNAAKVAGAKVPKDLQTRATLYKQRLDGINAYINKTYYKQQKQKAKNQ